MVAGVGLEPATFGLSDDSNANRNRLINQKLMSTQRDMLVDHPYHIPHIDHVFQILVANLVANRDPHAYYEWGKFSVS